jgi:hypothetical protein
VRKIAAAFLLVLYSVANIGLAARLDFCGEELHDISLYSQEEEVKDCCLAEKGIDDDCCSAEIIVLQESSDKIQKSSNDRSIAPQQAVLPRFHTLIQSGKEQPARASYCPTPQKDVQRRTHLLNACFLI